MPHTLTAEILTVLAEASDLSLCTLAPDGAPHAVMVSFASDQLALYVGCAPDSLKAQNIARDPRIAATITLPYRDWSEIHGLSLRGRARRLLGDAADAAALLFLQKFSEIAQYVSPATGELALFEIVPERVSLLDYRRGFGHVVHGDVRNVRPAAVTPHAPGPVAAPHPVAPRHQEA